MRRTNRLLALTLLLLLSSRVDPSAATLLQEDDLVFDDVGDDAAPTLGSDAALDKQQQQQPSTTASPGEHAKKWQRVEKLLGMPDAVASVGRVFKLHVPKQAFAGSIDYYEARGTNNKPLPHWLRWDEPASAFYGVPARKDMGRHRVSVRAFGKRGDSAQDSFYVHVVPEKYQHYRAKDDKTRCSEEQDRTMLSVLVDARYENLKPSAKVNALENLAGFFALPVSSLTIQPEASSSGSTAQKDTSVILSGPGHVKHRREKHSTIVQWQVGCDGHFWPQHIPTIKGFPEQARDGTLSEVMQLPVYQWRVRSDSAGYARNRRDTAGSGDDLRPDGDDDEEYDEEDEDYDDDNDYDNNEGITEAPPARADGKRKPPPLLHPGGSIVDEHPHRHHHGEDSVANIGGGSGLSNTGDDFIWNEEMNNRNVVVNETSPATTTTTTATPTIAFTLPSSTTTTTTTSTTTTTTEPPTTTPFSTTESTTESTTSSSTSAATEEPSPSPSTESTTTSTSPATTSTTTTTTETLPIETLTTENATSMTYNNLTQVVTSQSPAGPNITIDSLTSDNDDEDEEILTTERDSDNEIEPDLTTILQPNVYASPEPTSTVTTTTTTTPSSTTDSTTTTSTTTTPTPTSSAPTSGNVIVESITTEQQNNATSSIYPVNVTADEYTEASVPAREASVPTFGTPTRGENATEKIIPPDAIDPYDSLYVPSYTSTPATNTTTTTTTSTTPEPSTTLSTTSTTTPSTTTTTTTTTTEPTTTSTTTPSTTTTEPTTTTTTTTQATTTTTTEKIDLYVPPRNTPPKVERRLKKTSATQGKLLSYTIPDDTFSDPEDGTTKNLRLKIYERNAPLKQSYWLQFNENTQEVYGLPLEDQYGTYQFEVIAMDKEGLTANDRLDIVVQQHKQIRAFNHEFHIYLKIEKRSEFPSNVDWQLKVMRGLAELYGDSDLSYITVRSIDIDHDQAIYTWTNDSLARTSECPVEEIKRLYRVMVAEEKREEPSDALLEILGPEIKPKRIVYQGLEHCQETKETQVNKYPVPRNQIDQLNATVGQLFVYKVPKDTFFDEEDGDTRSMKAYLLTGERTEVPENNWLQFDSSNQEFFGVPLKEDVGRKTYQLVVKDKEGLEATDSLIAEVRSAPAMRNVMESSMTIRMNSDSFKGSSKNKREFIQKLQRLYGDKDPSAISLLSVVGNSVSTTVTWRNLTLPTAYCPHDEIQRLRRVLVNDDKTLTSDVYKEFHSENFNVEYVSVVPMGACHEPGHVHSTDTGSSDRLPTTRGKEESKENILMTYILPSVIIVAMIMLAGIIACILYKRRRSGKMSISEKDDERQSFRSRGIPVIFQDELDEKPDPGNKSPIILKEEKPPLPPPEYQRAEDGADIPMLSKENSEEPYQPPPPFATNRDSNRQNRPKPTPTYRKPPPYVPP